MASFIKCKDGPRVGWVFDLDSLPRADAAVSSNEGLETVRYYPTYERSELGYPLYSIERPEWWIEEDGFRVL